MTDTTTLAPTDAEIDAAYRKVWSTIPHAQRLSAFAHEIASTLAARWGAPAPASGEAMSPFGYFRAEPFGWTDCAESDEGAKPLYESPPPAQEARVPLSSKECRDMLEEVDHYNFAIDLIRAVEKHHGIGITAAQKEAP